MTESRILELLMKNANTKNPFPKLSPDCVHSISQSISDIMYTSLTTNCISQANYRLDLLLLLRKWIVGQKHNFQIDVTNYSCVINSLLDSKIKYVSANNIQLPLKAGNYEFENLDTMTEIMKDFTKQQELHMRKVKLQEIIQSRDRIKCKSINFSYCKSFTSKLSELYNTFERLTMLKNENSCKKNYINSEVPCENQSLSESNKQLREKQVQMAYSLLNLGKSNNDFDLLSKILKNIGFYEKLFPYEVELVNYLWQNWEVLQVHYQLILFLLEKFPFLYEREVIKLCKNVLQENEIDAILIDEVKKVLEISKQSKQLSSSIKAIFYEMYSLSGYNNKLLKCLDLLENI